MLAAVGQSAGIRAMSAEAPAAVARGAELLPGVAVELLEPEQCGLKPLGAALRSVPGIAGATELGANRTVLLLDVSTLVDEALTRSEVVAAVEAEAAGREEARPHGP